jgi:TatD DNase family protein
MRPVRDIRYIDFHTHGTCASEDTLSVINLMAGEDVPDAIPRDTLFSAGIHPWQLTDDNLGQVKTELLLTAAHPHVVMIGEAGFDRLKGAQGEIQYNAFLFQAALAAEMDRPVLIHCVKGWDELRQARREVKAGRPWIIHGFRGGSSLAASLAAEGYWFSLGAKGLTPGVLASVDHDRLLLETDDSGVPVSEVYRQFSEVTGYDGEKVTTMMLNNFNSLFRYSL